MEIKYHNRVLIDVRKEIVRDVAKFLHFEEKFRFIIASGIDTKDGYYIVYHFSYDSSGLIANIRVHIPHNKPEIDSITPLFTAANWIEREIYELFGIKFKGHPEPKVLISDGNWGEKEFPYRKIDKN
jgi:NADH:ubiquinone oxidoreductase subunit C